MDLADRLAVVALDLPVTYLSLDHPNHLHHHQGTMIRTTRVSMIARKATRLAKPNVTAINLSTATMAVSTMNPDRSKGTKGRGWTGETRSRFRIRLNEGSKSSDLRSERRESCFLVLVLGSLEMLVSLDILIRYYRCTTRTYRMSSESQRTRMEENRSEFCVSNRIAFHNLHATCCRSSLPLCQSCRVFFYFSECSRQGRHDHRGDA